MIERGKNMSHFDAIIGYDAIKQELIQISDVLKSGEPYGKLGVTPPRGLLLHGEPGVGKTLMAGAVIAESERKTFTCRKDKPNGDFVKAIKKTFADAAAAAPSIVFLDDMDKFANGDERHRDAEEYVTVQSCIDEIKGKDVFVLATANGLGCLPNSLLRAGRFDRVIEVENPTGADAVKIIEHYIGQKKFVGEVDASVVACMMDGNSCAELETVINEAGLYAGFERSDVITMDHFMRACLHTVYEVPTEVLNTPTPETNLSDKRDPRALIIYHEAGHAAMAEVLDPGCVTLVSAYSRKRDTGGFTLCQMDDKTVSAEDVYARVGIALGGMTALEQVFGVFDVGNDKDLGKAFGLVRRLLEDNCICGFGLHDNDYATSDERSARLEHAMAQEIERMRRKTREILASNRELLDAIARELAAKSVLTSADIARIKAGCTVTPVSL